MVRGWRRKTNGSTRRRVASDGLALDVVSTYTRLHREAWERADAEVGELWDAYLAVPPPTAATPILDRLRAHLSAPAPDADADADADDSSRIPRPVPSDPEQRTLMAERLDLRAAVLAGPAPNSDEDSTAHHRLAAETWRRVDDVRDREQAERGHAAAEAVAAFRAIDPDDDASAGRLQRVADALEAYLGTDRDSFAARRGTDVDHLVEATERNLVAFDTFLEAGFDLGIGPRPD